jgi:hypothetical protein
MQRSTASRLQHTSHPTKVSVFCKILLSGVGMPCFRKGGGHCASSGLYVFWGVSLIVWDNLLDFCNQTIEERMLLLVIYWQGTGCSPCGQPVKQEYMLEAECDLSLACHQLHAL